MKQITKYIGLFAILPLAMVALAPELVDDAFALKAEGFESEEKIAHTLALPIEPVSAEESSISPIIGVIGVEQ